MRWVSTAPHPHNGRNDRHHAIMAHPAVARGGQLCYNDAPPMPKRRKSKVIDLETNPAPGDFAFHDRPPQPGDPGTAFESSQRLAALRFAAMGDVYSDPDKTKLKHLNVIVRDPVLEGRESTAPVAPPFRTMRAGALPTTADPESTFSVLSDMIRNIRLPFFND